MSETPKRLLIDSPEDGFIESRGWASTEAGEEAARVALSEFTCGEPGEMRGQKPAGPAKRVYLRCENPGEQELEYQRWLLCEQSDAGAVEFFEFDGTDLEPLPEHPGGNAASTRSCESREGDGMSETPA